MEKGKERKRKNFSFLLLLAERAAVSSSSSSTLEFWNCCSIFWELLKDLTRFLSDTALWFVFMENGLEAQNGQGTENE